MKRLFSSILLALAVSPAMANSEYTATLSCSEDGYRIPLEMCFPDSGVEIASNDRQSFYEGYELAGIGDQFSDGLNITLPRGFSLVAENSGAGIVLRVLIKDRERNVVYSEEVGTGGVISIS